ncbi:MAG TPA: lysophospholipid acyltransferase family protein [Polyangiaceae bacterium]|nr:lysophospholipid acyltransferase family protein [Polyangiaceae bacterium]
MRLDLEVRDAIERLELPFNSLGVDPYGISKSQLRFWFTAVGAFYRYYFSVRTRGVEHIPHRGRAMLVGNHSGGIAIDAAMVVVSCMFEMNPPRLAQGMAEKFINRVPFMSQWASRTGNLMGLPKHAERLLEDDRLLMVFPEGARGTAKLFKERYSLVDFGTGFMRLALKTKTPIVPFVVLGGGEAFPTVSNAYKLGRLFGVPYVPVTAYGLPLPIPAKMEIQYGPPVFYSGTGNEDDGVVLGYVAEVKRQIAGMLEDGARRRRGEPQAVGQGQP